MSLLEWWNWEGLKKDTDPGVFLVYRLPEEVDDAMNKPPGILPAGLIRGANPAQSLQNLKNW